MKRGDAEHRLFHRREQDKSLITRFVSTFEHVPYGEREEAIFELVHALQVAHLNAIFDKGHEDIKTPRLDHTVKVSQDALEAKTAIFKERISPLLTRLRQEEEDLGRPLVPPLGKMKVVIPAGAEKGVVCIEEGEERVHIRLEKREGGDVVHVRVHDSWTGTAYGDLVCGEILVGRDEDGWFLTDEWGEVVFSGKSREEFLANEYWEQQRLVPPTKEQLLEMPDK